MVQLVQQGGIGEDMLEYLGLYFQVKRGEFAKAERDLLSLTFKKVVAKERSAIQLLDHLVDQPKLKRYETQMRHYLERQKDELRQKLTQIVQMLQTSCLPNSGHQESKAFFLNLIGDFYRYQIELIPVEEEVEHSSFTQAQKKTRRDRDHLIAKATEQYYEAFKLAVTFLNPTNATRLAVALNYTIFLADFKNDKQKALTLSGIIQELALTRIDDSASPDEQFT